MVVAIEIQADVVEGEPGGRVSGGFGGFGGVFGEVAGDHPVSDVRVTDADVSDVELLAPGYRPAGRVLGMRCGGESDAASGGADGVVEVGDGDAGRWRDDRGRVVRVNTVEADEGVEVDGAAGLEFGGFAVGYPHRRHRPTPTVRSSHADA